MSVFALRCSLECFFFRFDFTLAAGSAVTVTFPDTSIDEGGVRAFHIHLTG